MAYQVTYLEHGKKVAFSRPGEKPKQPMLEQLFTNESDAIEHGLEFIGGRDDGNHPRMGNGTIFLRNNELEREAVISIKP